MSLPTKYLYDPDGDLVGQLDVKGAEMREIWGVFRPKRGFEKHRSLFERYARACVAEEEACGDEWKARIAEVEAVEDEIDAIGFRLGTGLPDAELTGEPLFELRIRDGMFSYRTK